MTFTKIQKAVIGVAAFVVAAATISSTTVAIADIMFWSEDEQEMYVEQVASDAKARDVRKLKQEIFKLQLEVDAGKATPEDEAYMRFLQHQLEELQG